MGTSDYPYYYYTKLFNEGIRFLKKEALLKDYPGFFVLPFSELEEMTMSENKKKLIIVGTGPQAQIKQGIISLNIPIMMCWASLAI